ncbi:MAG: 2,3-bisphosphoglycerate-independent phosphoglycerate mutase [Patescibacteria group bacterium]
MDLVAGTGVKPVVLLILDGFGIAPDSPGNAIVQARTPSFDLLTARYPAMTLRASGDEVGLSWGEMGNSEVGHVTIGAGLVHHQTLPRINQAIASKEFDQNPALTSGCDYAKSNNSTLHLVGLISAGKVHGMNTHCFELLKLAKKRGVKRVVVHAILDGRDTLYNSGLDFISELLVFMKQERVGELGSLSGRYFAMDRDERWDRISKAYGAMFMGEGVMAVDPLSAIKESYARSVFDEEFIPTTVFNGDNPVAVLQPNDAIIFFNFRPDRARELVQAVVVPDFDGFDRKILQGVKVVTMTDYASGLPVAVAFANEAIRGGLSETLSRFGIAQLKVAESEKYAHITYFFNGTREEPWPGEERFLVPSPKVANYALTPAMSAVAIKEKIVQEIKLGNFPVIIANFANADMVGHSGDLPATIKAIEILDSCVGEILVAVLEANGALVITADHGNGEEVLNLQTGAIDKEHSTNPVPIWIASATLEGKAGLSLDPPNGDLSQLQPVGILADVAPTVLALLGVPVPESMTGVSLVP